jgi:plastocyanin
MPSDSGSRVLSTGGDFETAGEHAFYCIRHEKLGTKETVVVEMR